MLRGNHESRNMTENFTFRDEVINTVSYDIEVYDLFMEVFDALPVAAKVNDEYFCMHGGISPEISRIEDINRYNRFAEIPLEGVMCDLSWADPAPEKRKHKDWYDNKERECSFYFGRDPTRKLLDDNNLRSILRGH